MAITSVNAQFNGSTVNLTYNASTGYYECDLTAPNMPSVFETDGVYPISITATADDADTKTFTRSDYDILGLVVVLEFITDRTNADVEYVKELSAKYLAGTITEDELEEWSKNLKGALNLEDLKRNEFNLYCLSRMLDLGLTTKYNASNDSYNIPDLPRTTYFSELLANVTAVYNANERYETTPLVPSSPLNHFGKWNAIEQILHDAFYKAQE